MDNIVKLFNSYGLFTDDMMEVISFAPSDYLKNQILFRYLQYLKLPKWLKICDVLYSAKSTKHVSIQLRDGELQYFSCGLQGLK